MKKLSPVLVLAVAMTLLAAATGNAQTKGKETQMAQSPHAKIGGYRYGDSSLARSPITLKDLNLLKTTLLWTEADDKALRQAAGVLQDQTDGVLDTWYGYVGANRHLLQYFSSADGTPDTDYLQAVRKRFGQWILDVCQRPHDQAWLDWQYEIALRHHRARKNETDNATAVDHIPLRYITAFVYPITATMKPFLAARGHSPEEVEAMHQAWFKAVVLHVTVWSLPYVKDGDF